MLKNIAKKLFICDVFCELELLTSLQNLKVTYRGVLHFVKLQPIGLQLYYNDSTSPQVFLTFCYRLTHFRPMYHLWIHQVAGFYWQNVWKTTVEDWHFASKNQLLSWTLVENRLIVQSRETAHFKFRIMY